MHGRQGGKWRGCRRFVVALLVGSRGLESDTEEDRGDLDKPA